MSICNKCKLKQIKDRAKKEGKYVRVMRDPFHVWASGKSVYVINKNEKPSDENKVAWFAELTDTCCC